MEIIYRIKPKDYWKSQVNAWNFNIEAESLKFDNISRALDKYIFRCKNGYLLEAGCFLGRINTFYHRKGYKAIGLDVEIEPLKKIHSGFPSAPLVNGDVLHLPFEDETIDIYVSIGVLNLQRDHIDKGMQEANRVLKKGGIAFFGMPAENPFSRVYKPLNKFRIWIKKTIKKEPLEEWSCKLSLSEFKKFCTENMFKVIEVVPLFSEVCFWIYFPFFRKFKRFRSYERQFQLLRQGLSPDLNILGRIFYNLYFKKRPFLFSNYLLITEK